MQKKSLYKQQPVQDLALNLKKKKKVNRLLKRRVGGDYAPHSIHPILGLK